LKTVVDEVKINFANRRLFGIIHFLVSDR